MIQIGIDGNEANVLKPVGIGEYSFELLKKFEEFHLPAGETKFQIYLKNSPLSHMPKPRDGWRYRVIGPKQLWTQIALPLDLFLHRPRPDVFFTPTHYAPRFSPVPVVISIMDLSYIFFPELFKKSDLFQLTNWTAYSVKKATKILTISKASKDDIINIYKVKSDKIEVIYPGIKEIPHMDESRKKYGIEGEYILFVGTLQPRKNIVRLVKAFSQIVKKHPKIKLIIVGKKGWLWEDILNAPKKFSVEEKVTFLDFVSDGELASLYQHAMCFILPSLYEGFGLPVLEAMKYGCPVITSNTSSLPEAAGDAALYVDPQSTEDIAEKLEKIITNSSLRKELIEKGKKQIQKFSWEKSAQETLKVLENIV